jgi:hypothetical protein
MKKRILCALLALVLVISLCPVTALAAPTVPQDNILHSDTVVQQNPLYPNRVFAEELVIPKTEASTQDVDPDDYGTADEMAMVIRDGMKSRSSTITFYYHHVSSNSDIEEVKVEINEAFEYAFDLATAHTGNPVESDYLGWQWDRWAYE